MTHLPFIAAAYALTIGAMIGVIAWSFATMRKAEADAEAVRGRK